MLEYTRANSDLSTAQEIKGVTEKSIIVHVEPSVLIFPLLHVMLGIMNHILKRFLKWVDVRVELIPEEELTARDIWLDEARDMADRNEEFKVWDVLNQIDLQTLISEKKNSGEA